MKKLIRDVDSSATALQKEAEHATELLAGKVVGKVWRHAKDEVGIEFTDGTRFFVDRVSDALDLSITGD